MKNPFNKNDVIEIGLNPKLYPIDVIYGAAYTFLDRAYVMLDGDPEKEIVVKLKPKTKLASKKLAMAFNNELINYMNYKNQSERVKDLKNIILARALTTNEKEFDESVLEEDDDVEIPWEDD